jgi:hypothetical protein
VTEEDQGQQRAPEGNGVTHEARRWARRGGWQGRLCRALAAALCMSCIGEASVSYQGTVTEGAAPAHRFDLAPNPTGATPIADATVELVVDGRRGPAVVTGPDGSFAEIEQVFGGFAGATTPIVVRATTRDGRVVTYTTVYETTSDPTLARRFCQPPCPPVFLNLSVGPRQ